MAKAIARVREIAYRGPILSETDNAMRVEYDLYREQSLEVATPGPPVSTILFTDRIVSEPEGGPELRVCLAIDVKTDDPIEEGNLKEVERIANDLADDSSLICGFLTKMIGRGVRTFSWTFQA